MMYISKGGIARMWVEISLFKASFATMIRSCQYRIVVDINNAEVFIAKGTLSLTSIFFTLIKCSSLRSDYYYIDL